MIAPTFLDHQWDKEQRDETNLTTRGAQADDSGGRWTAGCSLRGRAARWRAIWRGADGSGRRSTSRRDCTPGAGCCQNYLALGYIRCDGCAGDAEDGRAGSQAVSWMDS